MTRTDMTYGLAVALLLGSLDVFASDAYLCAQLDRIRAEEKMPAIGAGVVVPDPEYPQYAPLPWRFITCASGVEQWGGSTPVTESHRFPVGSISKPITGLMVSRVIASEKLRANPRLRWSTPLVEIFPEIATMPGANHCYDTRTEAPAANPPKVFDTRVAIARRIRLRVLDASSPPRIVEIASASMGGARQRLPFWYRHGFEEVLSPPTGPRIDRPAELAPEIWVR